MSSLTLTMMHPNDNKSPVRVDDLTHPRNKNVPSAYPATCSDAAACAPPPFSSLSASSSSLPMTPMMASTTAMDNNNYYYSDDEVERIRSEQEQKYIDYTSTSLNDDSEDSKSCKLAVQTQSLSQAVQVMPPSQSTMNSSRQQRRHHRPWRLRSVHINEEQNTYHPSSVSASAPSSSLCLPLWSKQYPFTQEGLDDDDDGDDGILDDYACDSHNVENLWLQAKDYASIKQDTIRTLLAIKEETISSLNRSRAGNTGSRLCNHSMLHSYHHDDGTRSDNKFYHGIEYDHDHDDCKDREDPICHRGLEVVIGKLIAGTPWSMRTNQRRVVPQLIVQMCEKHRILSGSVDACEVRALYETLSHSDKIRAQELAREDARTIVEDNNNNNNENESNSNNNYNRSSWQSSFVCC